MEVRGKNLPLNELIKLYKNQNYSLRKLSKKYNISRPTLKDILIKNSIQLRSNHDAIKLSNQKHKRNSFSNDNIERAYLAGFVEGDITAFRKSKYTIRLITNSTHDDFLHNFSKAFGNYGYVRISPRKNKTFENYMWCVSADLDNSFSFLLPENRKLEIPELINSNKYIFLGFLAGYFDAEGSILIKKIRENIQYCLRLSTQNLDLLKLICYNLKHMGVKSIIYKNFSKGNSRLANKIKITYNNDYFALEIFRKSDVKYLLEILPLTHPEKVSKKKLVLRFISENFTKWNQVQPSFFQLKDEIKAKTNTSIGRAKTMYEKL